jgi:hypothetical protein
LVLALKNQKIGLLARPTFELNISKLHATASPDRNYEEDAKLMADFSVD